MTMESSARILSASLRAPARVNAQSADEEVGRAEVSLKVLVLDDDRAGVDRAGEFGRVDVDGERGVEPFEPTAEGRDGHVLDGEARRGMDWI